MASFIVSYRKTAKIEGGLSLDPDDSGNWTSGEKEVGDLIGSKFGVSAPLLCAYLKRHATKEDMANLTEVTAQRIYQINYWNEIKGDDIIHQEVADQLYDSAVNMGVNTAIMLIQRALGLHETKMMDSVTLMKINNP